MTPVPRTTRQRLCARPDCTVRYDPFGRGCPWPDKYCSPLCHLKDKPPAQPKPRAQLVTRASSQPKRRRPISEASREQRAAVASRSCIVCGEPGCDPAHLIDKSLCHDGDGDPRAVIALCRIHHRAYDEQGLSILEHLEPHGREALAYAVLRFGLISTLERVTNEHWQPTRPLLRAVPSVPGDAA